MHQSRISDSVTLAGGKQFSLQGAVAGGMRPLTRQAVETRDCAAEWGAVPLILRGRRAGRYSRAPAGSSYGRPPDIHRTESLVGFWNGFDDGRSCGRGGRTAGHRLGAGRGGTAALVATGAAGEYRDRAAPG